MRLIQKINKIYEELGKKEKDLTFYDLIELGSDETAKAHLFRRLQEVADSKGLKLTKEDGLMDPVSKVVHVDKDNEDPVESLFDMLDLDSLINIPIRTLEVEDIIKAIERKETAVKAPEDVNDYSMTVVLNYDEKKSVDIEALSQLLNSSFESVQSSVATSGKENEGTKSIVKYKIFAPKDVSIDELRSIISSNKAVFDEFGIKTIDITES